MVVGHAFRQPEGVPSDEDNRGADDRGDPKTHSDPVAFVAAGRTFSSPRARRSSR